MSTFPMKDMANTYIEHSIVINNFVTDVGSQLKNSLCRVFGDSVKYKWTENDNKPIIPDVSINCDIKNRRSTNFLGVPRFIMEVLSDATEQYDRSEKMELYKKVEVAEYWIVDWRKKQVEIYVLSPDENSIDDAEYRLIATVTEQNKEELKIHMFPNIKISFDQLFDGVD
ncbi:MAG: Uma2 family endonuclease [Lachnospiraceae bacterium]|nr:Uma2 family endonuclease [Lachnospiraceae bacterium]